MRAMANAHHARSLEQFSKTKEEFKEELTQDEVMSRHLMQLEDTLFEQNLCRIIEPFSCVEITHVAELIDLPVDQVERKYVYFNALPFSHHIGFPLCFFPPPLLLMICLLCVLY